MEVGVTVHRSFEQPCWYLRTCTGCEAELAEGEAFVFSTQFGDIELEPRHWVLDEEERPYLTYCSRCLCVLLRQAMAHVLDLMQTSPSLRGEAQRWLGRYLPQGSETAAPATTEVCHG